MFKTLTKEDIVDYIVDGIKDRSANDLYSYIEILNIEHDGYAKIKIPFTYLLARDTVDDLDALYREMSLYTIEELTMRVNEIISDYSRIKLVEKISDFINSESIKNNPILEVSELCEMFILQNKLNKKTIGDNWSIIDYIDNKRIDWFTYIITELAEAIESLNYKHWKQQKNDIDNFLIEAVDVIHFIISKIIKDNSTKPRNSDMLCRLATTVFQDARMDRIMPNDMEIDIDGVIDAIKDIMKKPNSNQSILLNYIKMLEKAHISLFTIYQIYLGKNILNEFRQNNGYKDGTYIKIWDGIEDNIYMLNKIKDGIDIDDLYEILENKYTKIRSR